MSSHSNSAISSDADRCVMCGLCSPHCPTYLETRDEGESPRGRVALIRGLASGALAPTPRLQTHLDNCLVCRSCETVCPAGVPVTSLIDRARADFPAAPAGRSRLLEITLARPGLMRLAGHALRLAEAGGLRRLARSTGLTRRFGLARTDDLLPVIPPQPRWRSFYPASGDERQTVALFRGCATGLLDNATLAATIRLLNRLGIGVHVPRRQVCCGALHRHSGAVRQARSLAMTNIREFGSGSIPIVGTASGCTAMLADYRQLYSGEHGAVAFADRVVDVNAFLARHWPEDVTLKPLPRRIAVHVPCSLSHGLHDRTSMTGLLRAIPESEVIELPDNRLCCGAAGSYMITHPAMADALLARKLEHLRKLRPDVLATANIGCALHFRRGLERAGMAIEVVHPVTLLERQLQEHQPPAREASAIGVT